MMTAPSRATKTTFERTLVAIRLRRKALEALGSVDITLLGFDTRCFGSLQQRP